MTQTAEQSQTALSPTAPPSVLSQLAHALAVVALLALAALLSISALLGDSLTYDELDHLTGGMSKLKTHDFRLAPGNPPLAQMWTALPLLLVENQWPAPETDGWKEGRVWRIGHNWLFTLNDGKTTPHDGQQLLVYARYMTIALLIGTCLCIYAAARTLFGPTAGLLALALAALSPELKAHGHFVTSDLPVTFCFVLTLLMFARLLDRVTPLRLIGALAALAALSLVKYSWPLILPALVAMGIFAVMRRQPIEIGLLGGKRRRSPTNPHVRIDRPGVAAPGVEPVAEDAPAAPILCKCGNTASPYAKFCNRCGRTLTPGAADEVVADDSTQRGFRSRGSRIGLMFALTLIAAISTWAGVWTAFGWRSSPFNGVERDQATMFPVAIGRNPPPMTMDAAWETIMQDTAGKPLEGVTASFIRWARAKDFLPEAYLYGLATVLRPSENRNHYLNGEIYPDVRTEYFPTAFAIKTPIATMLLLAAGIAALAIKWPVRKGQFVLARGLYVFIAVYVAYVATGAVNIGHRHLLPIYPAIFIIAAASAFWLSSKVGKVLVAACLVWLIVVNVQIHPHYLSYFNEIVGGPRNGHLYLADSNLDWGQDLKRLAEYARNHPDEKIKLAYFGTAKPDKYGFEVEALPSTVNFGKPAQLGPGTYVISVTQLLGIYIKHLRETTWQEMKGDDVYRRGYQTLMQPLPPDAPEETRRRRAQFTIQFEQLRYARLFQGLRKRKPDEFIGYSMWVYRLSAADLAELLRPPPGASSQPAGATSRPAPPQKKASDPLSEEESPNLSEPG